MVYINKKYFKLIINKHIKLIQIFNFRIQKDVLGLVCLHVNLWI